MATGTLLERVGRVVGGRPALGEWERDEPYQTLLAKLTELGSRREQITAELPEARAAASTSEEAQRRVAAAALLGDTDSKAVKSAERDLSAARERANKLEAELDATDRALGTLEERKPAIEAEARRRHVENVVRPWLEPLVTEFVPLLTRAAAISSELAEGLRQVEDGFPTDTYSPSPERFKPVNNFIRDGARKIHNISWPELQTNGALFQRWIAKVRELGYDR
jgi:hypothetical protein